MITECGIVESGPTEQRCQVVRWLRTFPFSFINQREYILARRLWRRDGCLYSECQQLCRSHVTKRACWARPTVSGLLLRFLMVLRTVRVCSASTAGCLPATADGAQLSSDCAWALQAQVHSDSVGPASAKLPVFCPGDFSR